LNGRDGGNANEALTTAGEPLSLVGRAAVVVLLED